MLQTPNRTTFNIPMNTHLSDNHQPTCYSELASILGMSTRPEYYSGRGVNGDLTTGMLRACEAYLESGESQGVFPKGALHAWRVMLAKLNVVAATPFLRAMRSLENSGWKVPEIVDSNGIEIQKGTNGYDESSVVHGMLSIFESSRRDPVRDTQASTGMKAQVLGRKYRSLYLGEDAALDDPYEYNCYHMW